MICVLNFSPEGTLLLRKCREVSLSGIWGGGVIFVVPRRRTAERMESAKTLGEMIVAKPTLLYIVCAGGACM